MHTLKSDAQPECYKGSIGATAVTSAEDLWSSGNLALYSLSLRSHPEIVPGVSYRFSFTNILSKHPSSDDIKVYVIWISRESF